MILTVNGISFSYPGHPVLKELSFELDRGRTLGLLGTNGAGKSTLLRCLNRILRPQGGTVLVGGRSLSRLPDREIARRMGYVPQLHQTTGLNVFEAVLLGRNPHIRWQASPRDLAVVEEVLRSLRLEELALRPMAELSGGQAQKVTIARALAQEPEILLLDEPTSGLDLRNQLEVMELIAAAVAERNIAAVISIHDLNLAFRHLDSVLMLKNGLIHALASPGEITPEMISQVYGVRVALGLVADRPVIIPLQAA